MPRAARPLRLALVAIWVAAWSAPAWTLDPGTVRGTCVREGRAIALVHAQSFRFRDLAALGEHADRRAELRILLAAREVPAALLSEVELKALERYLQRESIDALLVSVPVDAEGTVDGTLVALPGPPGTPLFVVHPIADVRITTRDHRVQGRLRFDDARAGLTVDADFSTPDFHETPPRERLGGDAARASAPAAAYLEFERLLRAGDFIAARRHVTPALLPQILDLEARSRVPAFLAQFTGRLPATEARRRQIEGAVIYDDRAYLVVRQRRTSLTTLRWHDGGWRVDD